MIPFPGAEKYSITYHHLFAILVTELARMQGKHTITILDVGCGSGGLIGFLQSALTKRYPNICFEIYGLDVADSKVQKENFFRDTVAKLSESHVGIDWNSRLTLLRSSDDWPFIDDLFDFVISNHVMEHIRDHSHTLKNLTRVLKPTGMSAHLFPLRNSWMEWHVKIPFAHWISNGDLLYSYIRVMSWLGFGAWRTYCKRITPVAITEFASMNRDFLLLETNYLDEGSIERLTKQAGLKYSFRYTEDMYVNRLRLAFGFKQNYELFNRKQFAHWLRLLVLKRVSSITLILKKDNGYINIGLHRPLEVLATIQ
jgi:SAM-dependent methyltransferase